jgi:hypothetical protein
MKLTQNNREFFFPVSTLYNIFVCFINTLLFRKATDFMIKCIFFLYFVYVWLGKINKSNTIEAKTQAAK